MTMCHAEVNGIKVAFDIHGSGPALILIMGYRLSSRAWPLDFIEALAERFTVVLFDNRGTGLSDRLCVGCDRGWSPDPMPVVPTGVRLHIIGSAGRASAAPDQGVNFVQGPRALLYVNPNPCTVLSGIFR